MAVIVSKIAEDVLGYSPAATGALEHVTERERVRLTKEEPKTFIIGKRRGFETAHFFKEARALARFAKKEMAVDHVPRCVVFFRDADGTRSTERGLYEMRLKSIQDGFAAEEYEFGVPMVPKPKCEAWLICALQDIAYQNCAALEVGLSGNDNAPESAKKQLEKLLTNRGNTVAELSFLVEDDTICALREEMKDMASFRDFDKRLRDVLNALQRGS